MIRTLQALAVLALASIVGCGANTQGFSPEYQAACDAEMKIYDEMMETQLATFAVEDAKQLDELSKKLDSLFDKLGRQQEAIRSLRPKTPNSKEFLDANTKTEELLKAIEEKTAQLQKLRSGNPAKELLVKEMYDLQKQAAKEGERKARCNPNPQ